MAGYERCQRDGSDVDLEFRLLWSDGTIRWIYEKNSHVEIMSVPWPLSRTYTLGLLGSDFLEAHLQRRDPWVRNDPRDGNSSKAAPR